MTNIKKYFKKSEYGSEVYIQETISRISNILSILPKEWKSTYCTISIAHDVLYDILCGIRVEDK